MEIKDLIEQCKKFEIYQQRNITENYAEIVMYTKEIFKWSEIFNSALGNPISPAGAVPTQEDLELTREYGGIFEDQTLYNKEFDDKRIIVMFWPWQDGKRVTIKVISLKK